MSTKSHLLKLLDERNGQCVSGQELAHYLGVSRNSIWKAVKTLQEQGYAIESFAGSGYRLAQKADIIAEPLLKDKLSFPCKIHLLDKVDSTNNYAKGLQDLSVPQLIVAEEQTAGRGRLGRSFYSPSGKGIYMSLALCPDLELERAMLTTAMTAVATCEALEKITGLYPKIKWVNDLYLHNKKICGILTEAETNFETGRVQKIIVGIGLNCFEDVHMPDDIKSLATYLENPLKDFSRTDLIAEITNQFLQRNESFDGAEIIRSYKARSFILGEQILVFNPAIARECGRPEGRLSEGIRARAIDIDEKGGLVVELLEGRLSRQMKSLTTGEISVRKL